MKIWQVSASDLIRGVGAAVLAGAVVLGFGLPAKASLIGDEIVINTGIPGTTCNLVTDCEDTVVVGDPGVELTNGDGSDFAGAIDPFNVNGSIDVFSESIEIVIDAGGVFTFIFSDLQWVDEIGAPVAGTLNDVTLDMTGLSITNFTVTDITNDATDGASFRVVLECDPFLAVDPCTAGETWVLALDVTHNGIVPPPAVPEPSALLLFAAGLASLGLGLRRRRTLCAERANGHPSLLREARWRPGQADRLQDTKRLEAALR